MDRAKARIYRIVEGTWYYQVPLSDGSFFANYAESWRAAVTRVGHHMRAYAEGS